MSSRLIAQWAGLSFELPRFHATAVALRPPTAFLGALASLPAWTNAAAATLDDPEARLAALDVFMVDAFARRHDLPEPLNLAESKAALARRLDIPPILTYWLYIRVNPLEPGRLRRFTATDEEARFIRMHRFIEDELDAVSAEFRSVARSARPGDALVAALPDLTPRLARINRAVAAFRSPERMDRDTFNQAFRPYFLSVPETDHAPALEGPSGLQSPAFRHLVIAAGYRDAILDGWTRRIAAYHEPGERRRMADAMAERDRGLSLTQVEETWFAPMLPGPVPHLHVAYGAHVVQLTDLATRLGAVTPHILTELADQGVPVGTWPGGELASALDSPPVLPEPEIAQSDRPIVAAAIQMEALLLGFHLEHVAITAHQIGYSTGTGGTSGVEFLLLATLRRAFPRLWLSGAGSRGIAELLAA